MCSCLMAKAVPVGEESVFVQVKRPQSIIESDRRALIRNDCTLGRFLL